MGIRLGFVVSFLFLAWGLGGWPEAQAKDSVQGRDSARVAPSGWFASLGGSKKDTIFNLAERPSGQLLGVGKTDSFDGDLVGRPPRARQDAWIVETTAEGRLLHSRAWGGNGTDTFAAAVNTPDGGFLVVGTTDSLDGDAAARPRRSSDSDIWVLKFGADSSLQWQRFLGGSHNDLGMAAVATADGGFLIGADSYSTDGDAAFETGGHNHHGCPGGHRDFLVLKLSGVGELQWARSFGGSNHEYFSQFAATSDGNFVLTGRTESFDGDVTNPLGEYDAWALKISPTGELLWETTLGGEMWDWGSNVVPAPDGGVLFSGYTFSWDRDGTGNKGDYDYFLVRLDSKGERMWSRTYGGPLDDFAQGAAALADGSFLITGGSVSRSGDVPENRGSFDLWAIRVSAVGDLLWSRTYGGSAYDIAAPGGSDYYMASPGGALIPTHDGGVAVAGASKSRDGDTAGSHGGYDGWIVRWTPDEWREGGKRRRGQRSPLRPAEPLPNQPAPATAPAIQWQRSFGGASKDAPLDSPQALTKAPDGYALIATTESEAFAQRGGGDVFVVRTDSQGAPLWSRTYGGSKPEIGAAIAAAPAGGFAFLASSDSSDGDVAKNSGGTDLWLVRLDDAGEILWQRSLGGSSSDLATSLVATADGGFLVGGTSYSQDGDVTDHICGYDFWVVKVNSRGETQWSRSLGGASNDFLIQLVVNTKGEIGVVGRTESIDGDAAGNRGMYDYLLVHLDPRGNTLWTRTYGGIDWEWGNSLAPTADGGYVMNGYTYTFDDFESGQVKCNHGEFDYWVTKVASDGKLQWQQCFGGSNYELGYGIIGTRDGGFAVVGGSPSKDGQVTGNHGGWDAWVVKMNGAGELQWEKSLGGSGYDVGYALVEAEDGGLVVLAETFSKDGDVTHNAGLEDAWLVKLAPPQARARE